MIQVKIIPDSVHQVRLPATVIYGGGLYQGETTFTPLLETSTVLPTENKILLTDVTVLPIPVLRESNLAGGITVTVGGEGDD